jgi:phosphate transport system protein
MAEHMVKAYEDELVRLSGLLARMGGMAEAQLADAIDAIVRRDVALADRIIETDIQIDQMDREIEMMAVRLLALRQPMGPDLRQIVSATRIGTDLERIGDLAKNIAKRVHILSEATPVRAVRGLERMGRQVLGQLKNVLDALAAKDADAARIVWKRDEEIDDMNNSLFRELLTYMMEDPRTITVSTHLLFIAKNLERIGDHCTNVAETIHYLSTGAAFEGDRPKGDATYGSDGNSDQADT